MGNQASWRELLRRLRWDLMDRDERKYYAYWLISEVPGLFGHMLRARYLAKHMKSAGTNLHVMAGCRFRSIECMEVGDNVSLGYDNFFQAIGGLTLGDHVATAPGVKIWTANHDYSDPDTPVLEQGGTAKPVVIGNDVFIASNAFILPGVHLAEGSIVAAGSVVGARRYRPYSILAGNPARVIGYRGNRTPAEKAVSGEAASDDLAR